MNADPDQTGNLPLRRFDAALTSRLMLAEILLPVFLIAIIPSLFFDFGRKVHLGFFELIAQVAPVLLLAALVEVAFVAGRELRRENAGAANPVDDGTRLLFSTWIRIDIAYFLVAEVAALYAVASERPTTFLFLLATVGSLLQLWDLKNATLDRLNLPNVGFTQIAGLPHVPLAWVIRLLPNRWFRD